jgi:hypothetical protein
MGSSQTFNCCAPAAPHGCVYSPRTRCRARLVAIAALAMSPPTITTSVTRRLRDPGAWPGPARPAPRGPVRGRGPALPDSQSAGTGESVTWSSWFSARLRDHAPSPEPRRRGCVLRASRTALGTRAKAVMRWVSAHNVTHNANSRRSRNMRNSHRSPPPVVLGNVHKHNILGLASLTECSEFHLYSYMWREQS